MCGTNACRMMVFTVAQLMDQVTDNNDWNVYKDWNAPLRREKMLLNPGTDDMSVQTYLSIYFGIQHYLHYCAGGDRSFQPLKITRPCLSYEKS